MNNTLTEVITPEIRAQIQSNSQTFEAAVKEVLAEFGVDFQPGMSLSKMVKESPAYPKEKKDQTPFFNKVKSACKAYKLGEALTVEAVINRGFWVRFNGSTVHKDTKNIKTIGVTLVDPTVKASKEDDNYNTAIANKRSAAENAKTQAALNYFKSKFNVSDEDLAKAIQAQASVVE
jgi:hypothetical protein